MVSADMDLNQSEAFLTSQMKKPEGGITENQANAFRKFWKNHKNKIHEAVIAHSTWNNTLKHVSWRIDIQSQARHIDQINAPTAIMELQLGPKTSNSQVINFNIKEKGKYRKEFVSKPKFKDLSMPVFYYRRQHFLSFPCFYKYIEVNLVYIEFHCISGNTVLSFSRVFKG